MYLYTYVPTCLHFARTLRPRASRALHARCTGAPGGRFSRALRARFARVLRDTGHEGISPNSCVSSPCTLTVGGYSYRCVINMLLSMPKSIPTPIQIAMNRTTIGLG